MLKNLMKYSILTSILICLFLWFSLWYEWSKDENPFPYENDLTKEEVLSCDEHTNLWDCVSTKEDEDGLARDSTIIRRLLWVFWLRNDKREDLKFIDYAKAILNITLSLISFIALIMTIYTFYMMFFSENEAWIKKAKESLIGIFIALGVIWLAWIVVSFIFRWYESNLKEKEEEIGEGNVALMNTNTQNYQIYLTI